MTSGQTGSQIAGARAPTVHRRENPVGLMGQARVEEWQGCTVHQTFSFPLEPLKQSCGVAHARSLMPLRALHPQHTGKSKDIMTLQRPDIKSKEPSVKRARRYNAGTNSRKDDANADSHEYDADTDALIRIHAPIKDESKYHLAPLMNKTLLPHCRGVSPTASTTSSPRLHCCHMDTRSGTSAICTNCPRKRTAREIFMFVIPAHANEA